MASSHHLDSPQRTPVLLGIAATVLLLLGLMQSWEWTRGAVLRAEWKIHDILHLTGDLAPVDEDIVVLGIDDASLSLSSAFPEDIEESQVLQWMERGWPWPRAVWATLTDRLLEAGARAVAIDLAFATPTPGHPEWDEALADALEKWRDQVVVGVDYDLTDDGRTRLVMPTLSILGSEDNRDPRLGFFTYWTDGDDIIRRQYLTFGEDTTAASSFPVALLRQSGERLPESVTDATDEFGMVRIRYSHPAAYTPLSIHELAIPALWESNFAGGEAFRDKLILIGPTTRHFQDDVRTPVGVLFGVQAHAHFTGSFRNGHVLKEVPRAWVWLLAILGAFATIALIIKTARPLLTMGVIVMGVACGLALEVLLLRQASLILPSLLPGTAIAATGLIGMTYDFVLERRQKEKLRGAVSRYFSPDVAQQILNNPESYFRSLGGARRVITLLFSDLRGFTTLSEKYPAEELVEQLNEYLERMVATVFETRGSIDKFIGDAIMAVWGRLKSDATEADLDQDARDGIRSALAMRQELEQLNLRWEAKGKPALAIGVGLHQGDAVVGNMGSPQRMEFTAIGDTVNLAARLEGVTKQYGVDLIVSDTMRERAGDAFLYRTADLVKVKGKDKPVEVFTVLGPSDMTPPSGLASFEGAVGFYRRGEFEAALRHFETGLDEGLDDKLSHEYIDRCRRLIADPPPGVWNGVYTMTTK